MERKELTPELFEQLFRKYYRVITGQYGKNKFYIKINRVGIHNIKVNVKSVIRPMTWTNKEWIYYDGSFRFVVSKRHDLPYVCDNLLNMYSRLIREKNGIKIYIAVWLHQSLGIKVYPKYGFIVEKQGRGRMKFYYHAETWQKAYNGVIRKAKIYYNSLKENKVMFTNRIKKIKLSFNDSIKAGNCKSGTLSFCRRYNLDPENYYTIGYLLNRVRSNTYRKYLKQVINYKTKNI